MVLIWESWLLIINGISTYEKDNNKYMSSRSDKISRNALVDLLVDLTISPLRTFLRWLLRYFSPRNNMNFSLGISCPSMWSGIWSVNDYSSSLLWSFPSRDSWKGHKRSAAASSSPNGGCNGHDVIWILGFISSVGFAFIFILSFRDGSILWKALEARVINPVRNSRHRDLTSYQPYEMPFLWAVTTLRCATMDILLAVLALHAWCHLSVISDDMKY